MALIDQLQTSPSFFISFCAIIGVAVGSFLSALIYRLPKMLAAEWDQQYVELKNEGVDALPARNLVAPWSCCPHCEHKLTGWENIPIASYIMLRGRCSHCRIAISLRYPAIELLTGVLSGLVAWHFGYGVAGFFGLVFAWAMIALAFIDMDVQLLPDRITLPLLWIGLLVNLNSVFTDIHSAVIGAAAGYLLLWMIYCGCKLISGKEGLGRGDLKLLAAIGAWVGWDMLPLVILFSSLTGAMAGIILVLLQKQERGAPIPFGPYLAGGSFVAIFWGKQINPAYFGVG
jgi:leader peptidase (prepilin peptidase) / N-methyltransferase